VRGRDRPARDDVSRRRPAPALGERGWLAGLARSSLTGA